MDINVNFDERVLVHSADLDWVDSPMAGVQRRSLDRVGDEVARATTIVRYAPGSHFSPHVHTGGEEFLVLDGVFQDEHGDFPAGSYIRNPIGSSHTPGSEPGCTILVKLWQFDPTDDRHVRIRTDHLPAVPNADHPGISTLPLYRNETEEVYIHILEPAAGFELDLPGGAELLVLQGQLEQGGDQLKEGSWLRLPTSSQLTISAGETGARFWLKTGHLTQVEAEISRLRSKRLSLVSS